MIKQGTPATNIAALTFTNKAAREMKSRVANLLDTQKTRGLRVSTFHSLGLDIIRKEHKILEYKSSISLFDEQDKLTLLRSLVNHQADQFDIDQLDQYAQQISQWKNAFFTPEQASLTATAENFADSKLYAEYVRSLKAYNAFTFSVGNLLNH